MSLREFVGQNNKFAKDTLDSMQRIKKASDEAKEPEQRRRDLDRLEDELFIVLTGQEG